MKNYKKVNIWKLLEAGRGIMPKYKFIDIMRFKDHHFNFNTASMQLEQNYNAKLSIKDGVLKHISTNIFHICKNSDNATINKIMGFKRRNYHMFSVLSAEIERLYKHRGDS